MKYLLVILLFVNITNVFSQDFLIHNYKKTKNIQKGMQWCWAASLSGIFHFYNKNISQDFLVKTLYPNYYNKINKDSPIFSWKPNQYKFQYPNENYKDYLVDELIPHFNLKAKVISFSKVKFYLKKNIPILIGFDSHIRVIVGYSDNKLIMMDPWKGNFQKVKKSYINYAYRNDYFWNPILIAVIKEKV